MRNSWSGRKNGQRPERSAMKDMRKMPRSEPKSLTKEFEHFSKDIAFVTQPIIPGHAGSEAFARRRRQIAERFEKGMQEYRKSDYFKETGGNCKGNREKAPNSAIHPI